MKQVPKTKIKISDVKDVFNEGYNLLSKLRKDVDTPVVKAEFLTKEVRAIYGVEAARKYYDPEKFKREGAMPKPDLKTLFREEDAQTLDGKAHNQRRNYFIDLMNTERMEDYRKILDRNLSNELNKQNGEFELFDLANKVLFNSISEWSGINLENYDDEKLEKLAENQISMISGAVTSP